MKFCYKVSMGRTRNTRAVFFIQYKDQKLGEADKAKNSATV